MKKTIETEYALGQVVKHKYLDFRGVIYDVYRLHAGRGNNFTIKEGTQRVNWEETDRLGEYKPKWRQL